MATKKKSKAPPIRTIVSRIQKVVGETLPSVTEIARRKPDPYRILVSTIISLRTKDEVTEAASERLFAIADTPATMMKTNVRTIEKAIYPAGFYKTKARTLKDISKRLADEYDGKVPASLDELLTFKGVGRKTANLVITLGYGIPGICVDTHVHRIANRLGLIDTKTPDESEFALMAVLPQRYWIGWNQLMVSFGQQICKPISPLCSQCPLDRICPKIGVTKHR